MEVSTPSLGSSTPSTTRGTAPPLSGPNSQSARSEPGKIVSMRGRKKHKCSVCGNIARSRCPFHSCKGCCVKARNPCYIHVFKSSPTGESTQGSAGVPPYPPGPSAVIRHPVDSLRLKTVKPVGHITRKEAAFINGWRFQKLKDFTEGNIAAEDEAFDRYMQNVSLLEEVFAVNAESLEGLSQEGHLLIDGSSGSDSVDGGVDAAMLSAGLRVRLRSSSKRKEACKQRIRRTIDRSLQKLHRGERADAMLENEEIYMGFTGARREIKRMKVQSTEGKERLRRMDLFNSLFEKVKQVENQEDFDSCLKIYEENFLDKHRLTSTSGRLGEANRGKANSTSSKLQEVTTTDHLISAGEGDRESSKDSLSESGDSSISALIFGTSYKAKVDSFGVLKGSWKVDLSQECWDLFKETVDGPTSGLEPL